MTQVRSNKYPAAVVHLCACHPSPSSRPPVLWLSIAGVLREPGPTFNLSAMFSSVLFLLTFTGFLNLQSSAADAQQWRSRSIYQVHLIPSSIAGGRSMVL